MLKRCYQCDGENPSTQTFCGRCGSPLDLKQFVENAVSVGVSTAVRDRDILEKESAIRVFEQAYGWLKTLVSLLLAIVVAVLGLVSWLGYDKYKNFSEAVDSAKRSVGDTASDARKDVGSDVSTFKKDLEASRSELKGANQLQPQMKQVQAELTKATSDIKAQQRVLFNSETFAKEVLSSHVFESFERGKTARNRYAITTNAAGNGAIYILLQASPIPQTVQLQWGALFQSPTNYSVHDNLLIVNWSYESIKDLPEDTLSVSYFPDSGDRNLYKALSVTNGKAYADGKLLAF